VVPVRIAKHCLLLDQHTRVLIVMHEQFRGWAACYEGNWLTSCPRPPWFDSVREQLERVLAGVEAPPAAARETQE